jgi:hypothetical protein
MGQPLPIPSNVTVDIYRNANPAMPLPQGTPAVPQAPGFLKPTLQNGRYGSAQWLKWTHILILPPGTDVRDAYNTQLDPSRQNNNADTVVLTDSGGVNKTPFYVVFVEQAYRGTPLAQLRVYLDRFQPSAWPVDSL